jgi:hypothetical protein
MKKKMVATCQQNVLKQITKDNKKLQTERQNESGETIKEISGCVRLEQVNKWPNSWLAGQRQ